MKGRDNRISGDEARSRLYEVMRTDCPMDERVGSVPEVGTEYLGVEHGFVATLDRESDDWEVIVSTDTRGEGWGTACFVSTSTTGTCPWRRPTGGWSTSTSG